MKGKNPGKPTEGIQGIEWSQRCWKQ